MTVLQIMDCLKAAGTAENRKVYRRHGMHEPFFGVSFAELNRLKKAIKTNHGIARQLWATGNWDARHLACMVADPHHATPRELDQWLAEIDYYFGVGIFVNRLVSQTPHARRKAFKWMKSRREWTAQAGWKLIACGAADEKEPDLYSDDELLPLLDVIENEIHGVKNRVREAMNDAVIGIGVRGGKCKKAALAAASRIGRVEIDHGETGCQTPDAAAYIKKTLAHRKAKAARKKTKASKRAKR